MKDASENQNKSDELPGRRSRRRQMVDFPVKIKVSVIELAKQAIRIGGTKDDIARKLSLTKSEVDHWWLNRDFLFQQLESSTVKKSNKRKRDAVINTEMKTRKRQKKEIQKK